MLRYSSLLPIEIVVTDEGVDALLEIMRPILVVIAVTTSLFVEVPEFNHYRHKEHCVELQENLKLPDQIPVGTIIHNQSLVILSGAVVVVQKGNNNYE